MSRAVRAARRAGFARKRAHLVGSESAEPSPNLDALLAQLPALPNDHAFTKTGNTGSNGQSQSAYFRRYPTLKAS